MKSLFLKFLGINATIWKYLSVIVGTEIGKLLTDLLPIAEQVVLELATQPGSAEQKRDQALELVKARAAAAGINAGISVLDLAIRLAYTACVKAKE